MIRIRMDATNPDAGAIRAAAEAIRKGELVIFPTETVYGLAADATNDEAVLRVFAAKGRGWEQSLPVQIADPGDLGGVAAEMPEGTRRLAEKYWPGPLTIVLKKSRAISEFVTGGRGTVGVRIPDHPVALALLRELGAPIVATSANLSGEEPATNAGSAVRDLGHLVSVVLDAGECRLGVPSTVVDLSVSPPRILRRGAIPVAEIREILGEVEEIEE